MSSDPWYKEIVPNVGKFYLSFDLTSLPLIMLSSLEKFPEMKFQQGMMMEHALKPSA